jgi:hypothetical protein
VLHADGLRQRDGPTSAEDEVIGWLWRVWPGDLPLSKREPGHALKRFSDGQTRPQIQLPRTTLAEDWQALRQYKLVGVPRRQDK